jgi:phage gp36-like protein
MPADPNVHSSDIAYATPDELIIRYDKRLISRLISDTGVPITDEFDFRNNNVLKTLLREASAIVESYAYKGRRYTKEDLKAIYNDTTKVGRELLISLVCAITLYLLWRRRGDPAIEVPKDFEIAENMLRRLERGENIFAWQGTMDAGSRMEFVSNATLLQSSPRTIALRRFIGNAGFTDFTW